MQGATVRLSICSALLLWACLPATTGGGGDRRGEGGAPGQRVGDMGGAGAMTGRPGSPCTVSADCVGGVCIEVDGQRACVEECDDIGDCPDGFGCRMGLCLPDMASSMGGNVGTGGTPSAGGRAGGGGRMGAAGRSSAGGESGGVGRGGAVTGGNADGGKMGDGGRSGDDCDGVDCGAHGVCEAGECVCSDGYFGPRCAERPLMGREAVDACQAFMGCTDGCGADAECLGRCDGQFPAGSAVFERIIQCAMDQGCVAEGDIDRECLGERCAAELLGCFGDRPEPRGDLSCMHTNLCLSECGDRNLPCVDDCIAASDPRSYPLLEAMQACSERAGCRDFACIRQACPDPYMACRHDSTGPETCIQIADCWFACRDDASSCPWECMYSGTFASQMTFETLLECMDDHGCGDPNQCPRCEILVFDCFID